MLMPYLEDLLVLLCVRVLHLLCSLHIVYQVVRSTVVSCETVLEELGDLGGMVSRHAR
jgi:hypothetical protein